MKRLLLTGIGGSIGCHTMRHILQNTDWEIIGIDSFRHKGLTDRVEFMLNEYPEGRARVRIVTHDLAAPISNLLAAKIGHVDYIINMASLSDVPESLLSPTLFINTNIALTLTMLEYARIAKPEIFLQISTDEVYGPTEIEARREWSPIVPSSPYSASKASQEAIAISYWRSFGLPLIIVNFMNNFGEMQSLSKFPAIVQRKVRLGETLTIHGTPEHVGSRFYIHSRNAADAFLFLLLRGAPFKHTAGAVDRPDRYNIAGDKKVSNMELAETIAYLAGYPFHYRFENFGVGRAGHDSHYSLDGRKLAALGWKAPISFDDALKSTTEWYNNHPEWLDIPVKGP